MASKERHQYIMSGLLAGWDWFDNGLQNAVRTAGFNPLNKSQSMMVLYISAGVTRPIEIARKMRLSRQAIRHISSQLMDMGVIKSQPDPDDARSLVLTFASKSTTLRDFAEHAILKLEQVLESRIGKRKFSQLIELLSLDWGDVVSGYQELELETPCVQQQARRKPRVKSGKRAVP